MNINGAVIMLVATSGDGNVEDEQNVTTGSNGQATSVLLDDYMYNVTINAPYYEILETSITTDDTGNQVFNFTLRRKGTGLMKACYLPTSLGTHITVFQ